MSSLTSLTINDNQGTPVLQTFEPIGPAADGTQWFEGNLSTDSNPTSYSKVRISAKLLRAPPLPAGGMLLADSKGAPKPPPVNRVRLSVHVPTPVNDYSVAFIERANIEFILPEGGSDTSRGTLWALSRNLLDEAIIKAMVVSLSGLY